jgi:hypothetical protein
MMKIDVKGARIARSRVPTGMFVGASDSAAGEFNRFIPLGIG